MNKKTQECIDCNEDTNDFYRVATNRGDIIKCRDCYELWVLRTNRANWYNTSQQNGRIMEE